jgi:glutathione peroxidase-family protein
MKNPREAEEFYELEAKDADGRAVKFSAFKGHPLIIVNVASLCGLADRNYSNLAGLLKAYHRGGLRVLLFPCNQYLRQEPGTIAEIKRLAGGYSTNFIIFDKVNVIGKEIHPVFNHLVNHSTGTLGSHIKWNFTKFVVNKDGLIVKRVGPTDLIKEDDKVLVECMAGTGVQGEKPGSGSVRPEASGPEEFSNENLQGRSLHE